MVRDEKMKRLKDDVGIVQTHTVVDALITGHVIFGGLGFEKVGLGIEGRSGHEREWIFCMIDAFQAKLFEKIVCDGTDVPGHQFVVHADEAYGKAFGDEFGLDFHGIAHHFLGIERIEFLMTEMRIEKNSKVGVQALITCDPFVRFAETIQHEAAFFEPEDGTKAAAKEKSFDNGKGKETDTERAITVNPFHGPLSFFLNTGDFINTAKKTLFLIEIGDISINHQGIYF